MQFASMETETVAAALHDDLLAIVLGCLPARSLAASRGVCKAWRDLIDERQLLLRFRHLLPHSVRGLFINYQGYPRPQFLSRPTSWLPEDDGPRRRFDGKFDFIQLEDPRSWYQVVDHCNGLVLVRESGEEVLHVCNPTTRWSARLPPWPGRLNCRHYNAWDWGRRAFLVFDPFVSPEYKVLLSPERGRMENDDDDACRLMEWPPSAWNAWHVISSSTGRWQEKVFVREGEAAGTHEDLLLNERGYHTEPPYRYAAYWNGALYIHGPGEFVSRLSLLDDKYRVIKSPIKFANWKNKVRSFLGRSDKGVYMAAITTTDALTKLQVWTLCESSNNQIMEWVPKDESNLKLNTYSWSMENNRFDEPKCWTTLDLEPEYWMNHWGDRRKTQDASLEQNVCWNSDDDNIVEVSDDEQELQPSVKFLGFNPYKEVIFLSSSDNVVAFHLNSPVVQYLGTVNQGNTCYHPIQESFVYTPCFIGD